MLIEFFGPAGAGKTTIMKRLAEKLKEERYSVSILRKCSEQHGVPSFSLRRGHGLGFMVRLFLCRPKLVVAIFNLSLRAKVSNFRLFLSSLHMVSIAVYGRSKNCYLTDHGVLQNLLEVLAYDEDKVSILRVIERIYLINDWYRIGVCNEHEVLMERFINSEEQKVQKVGVDMEDYYLRVRCAMSNLGDLKIGLMFIKNDVVETSVSEVFSVLKIGREI